MKMYVQHLLKTLKSRLALNLYFWVLFALLQFGLNFYGRQGQYYYPQSWYSLFRVITTVLIASLLYINNLWLIPKYFSQKKYKKYLLLVLPLTYITGLSLSAFFTSIHTRFPKISMEDVSLFTALEMSFSSHWLIFFQALSWTFTLLLCITVFTIAWHMQDYAKRKKKSEEAQKKQVEAELKFLKSQINPHFLFNTLNNLYALTVKKSDMAPEVVSKLSVILRYLLYESNTHEVTFEKEKEIMHAYIDLEILRLTKKENLTFSVTADKPYMLPPLLWVPILENVFKHGTRFISKDHFIDYIFDISDNKLTIYSKNRFKQDTDNDLDKASGIGLMNLKKRLALLYPDQHEINTEIEGAYYITRINVNLS